MAIKPLSISSFQKPAESIPSLPRGKYSKNASKHFAELKDTYLQLLQEGYKPQDIEKFIKDIQTNPDTKSPTPQPGTKSLTSIYKKSSDADNFKGKKINESCNKNPKANEDIENLKTNNFNKKTCKGSFSTFLNYLRGE